MHALVWLLVWLWCCALPASSAQDRAIEAYRAGEHALARTLWEQTLTPDLPAAERARLCLNLGNACYRLGELHRAVAWYSAGLRLTPRNSDLWHNLELARAEAGLEPADRGDLEATLARLLSSLTLAESEWLLLLALGVLGVALMGEAYWGRVFRVPAWLALTAVLIALGPWLWNLVGQADHPRMVVESKPTPARSEPHRTAKVITELAPGTVVRETDSLPEWIEVETGEHGELWVRSAMLFALDR